MSSPWSSTIIPNYYYTQLFATVCVEETTTYTELTNKLEFLGTMRILHHEAITMPDYTRDCYDDQFYLKNNGWLTLVAPVYFEFGKELMSVIRNAFNQNRMDREGDDAPRNARVEVKEARERLKLMFLDCVNGIGSLDKLGKVEVFDSLLEKTTNARFGMVLKNYKANNTGRQGKHRTDGTFRGALKAKTKKTEVNEQQPAI